MKCPKNDKSGPLQVFMSSFFSLLWILEVVTKYSACENSTVYHIPSGRQLSLKKTNPIFLRVETSGATQRIYSSHYLFPRGILLAGKNTGVSMSWLGNFVIDRGFALELLTFSSISTRAGCRNSEYWGRLKKKNPFPLPESSHKHTTAGQSDCACGLSRIWKRAEFLAGK